MAQTKRGTPRERVDAHTNGDEGWLFTKSTYRGFVACRSILMCNSRLPKSPMLPYCCSIITRREHRHMPTNLWQPGVSGNPAGRLRGSRNKLSEEVICALLRDFRKHGE